MENELVKTEEKQLELHEKVAQRLLDGKDIKRSFDQNYLKKLLWDHKEKPIEHIIDFLHKAQLSGADPRRNEIYLVGYNSSKGFQSSIIYSYHFLLKQAAKSQFFGGIQVESIEKDIFDPTEKDEKKQYKKELVSIATAYRGERELKAEVVWSEFFQAINPIWREKKRTMLEKCAVAKVCRLAFPDADIHDIFIEGEYLNKTDDSNDDQERADAILGKFTE